MWSKVERQHFFGCCLSAFPHILVIWGCLWYNILVKVDSSIPIRDRKDSISIESQIEFCKYELRGGNFKDYKDKGFSGKNTDSPRFQELMADIKRGLFRRVVVYKLDRISRSILDFATMMELFQQYNVA